VVTAVLSVPRTGRGAGSSLLSSSGETGPRQIEQRHLSSAAETAVLPASQRLKIVCTLYHYYYYLIRRASSDDEFFSIRVFYSLLLLLPPVDSIRRITDAVRIITSMPTTWTLFFWFNTLGEIYLERDRERNLFFTACVGEMIL